MEEGRIILLTAWGTISRIFGGMTWSKHKLSGLRSLSRATLVLTGCLLCSSLLDRELTRRFSSPLTQFMECGLFEPEKGEGQMWGQRNLKFAAVLGMQLLAKIHCLESHLGNIGQQQNHPVDKLAERINFIGDASDRVGGVVDELNSRINTQEVQISQLADMINDLIGKTEGQAKEIKEMKLDREHHCKIINTLTAKVIFLEQCAEDLQRKAFPKVRESGINICCWLLTLFLIDSYPSAQQAKSSSSSDGYVWYVWSTCHLWGWSYLWSI
jgi:hypothetical protein